MKAKTVAALKRLTIIVALLLFCISLLSESQGGEQKLPTEDRKAAARRAEDAWRTDWQMFLAAASDIIRKSGGLASKPKLPKQLQDLGIVVHVLDAKAGGSTIQGKFYERFQGVVHWKGTVSSVQQGKVGVKMPPVAEAFPTGWKFIDIVWVKLRDAKTPDLARGTDIAFRGTLMRPTDKEPFSGMMVLGGGEEKTVTIHLVNGELEP